MYYKEALLSLSRNLFKQKNVLSTQPEVRKTGPHAAIVQFLTVLYGDTCRMSRGVCPTSLGRMGRRAPPTYCGGDWHVLGWVCYGCVADRGRDPEEDVLPYSQNCPSFKATQVYRRFGQTLCIYSFLCFSLQLQDWWLHMHAHRLGAALNFGPTCYLLKLEKYILFVIYQILNQVPTKLFLHA